MPPTRRDLSESLARLKAEVEAASSLPPGERARLEALLGQALRSAEGERDGDDDDEDSLADRLRELTKRFEEEHPNLTLAIGAVADALSRAGI